MMRIGLVTEHHEHDGKAFKALLQKRFPSQEVLFLPSVKRPGGMGSGLDAVGKIKKIVGQDIKYHRLDWVIYIRDLDGFVSDTAQIKRRQVWFDEIDRHNNPRGLPYLAVYDAECLALSDLEGLKKWSKINSKGTATSNPMQLTGKEALKKMVVGRQYQEGDMPEVFAHLDIDRIAKRHKGEYSFAEFIENLDKKLNLTHAD